MRWEMGGWGGGGGGGGGWGGIYGVLYVVGILCRYNQRMSYAGVDDVLAMVVST